ncbi:MAG: Outer membrane protein assembly factor BamE [Paracidovorax wautersii]|uniref:Outer membrane protein assembly factor BamE n=1 Tax=Paracidovorax wautersii TaxID=1177982 RepID=A0A7V8JPX4_9BURK|nr:MAG: Outer membrane protein assembly factor BamE [Paracidovorax wautersii]
MSLFLSRSARLILPLGLCVVLAACATADRASQRAIGWITPYKADIIQGNVVTAEQVQQLQAGMTRNQVRTLLGTPLVVSVFHQDRWDYVFTIRRQGVAPMERKFTVFFSGDTLARWEGDSLPSETEFATLVQPPADKVKVPELSASPDKLKDFAPKPGQQTASGSAATTGPVTQNYPPLE